MSRSVTQASSAPTPALHLPAAALWVLLGATFLVQAIGVFRRNINWDEFIFLSIIHSAERGEPLAIVQTAYVHLFGWLPDIGENELNQIIVARSLYLVVWVFSLILLYRLGCRVLDRFGAFAAVVLFASFSYCLTHAASFRIDGLLLPVLLGHLLLLTDPVPAPKRVIAAGALFGLAVVLSIKAVLWAPLSGALLYLWIRKQRTTWWVAIASAATAAFVAALLFLLHRTAITTTIPTADVATSAGGLAPIFSYMFLSQGLFPRAPVLVTAALTNLVTVSLVIRGVLLASRDVRRESGRASALLLLLLALPALSLTFYSNAWPYAYVTLIPTACFLAGYAVSQLTSFNPSILLVLIVGAAAPVVQSLWILRTDGLEAQRQVISVVHELFETPVPYIDRTGMIPSFPRAAFNMTQLGLTLYNQQGVPDVANKVRTLHPPLLIMNTPVLDVWADSRPRLRLLAEDEATLRAAYVHYWGAIYLAGREWRGLGAGQTVGFELLIPGEYTLVSDAPALIDGELRKAGTTLLLASGEHTLEAVHDTDRLRLLWGRDVTVPAIAPSAQPIFTGL